MEATSTVDRLERELVELEHRIGRLRMAQMELVEALDRAQVASMDGSRTMAEWVASRLDVEAETAAALVRTARTASDRPEAVRLFDDEPASFDRVAATMRLAASGALHENLDHSRWLGLPAVARLLRHRRRVQVSDERAAYAGRHLVMQPSLDQSAWRMWGMLPGYEGRIVDRALTARADELPSDPAPASRAQRRADALAAICEDALDGASAGEVAASTVPLVTVFVGVASTDTDPPQPVVEIESGPPASAALVDRLLCGARVEVTDVSGGVPLSVGRTRRTIPPRLRRYVLWRDGGCTVDGCRSRYRLQVHHVIPWSAGGTTDEDNLTTLCWYHHHVVVHGEGRCFDPDSPPDRRRFLRPARRAGPP